MKAEAEQNAAADKAERDKVDKMNQADSMVFTTENFLKDNAATMAHAKADRRVLFIFMFVICWQK